MAKPTKKQDLIDFSGLVCNQAKLSWQYNPDLQNQRLDAMAIEYDKNSWSNLPTKGISETFPSRKAGRR